MLKIRRTIIFLVAVFASLSAFSTASAAVADWQKAVSIYPSHPTDFDSDSFRQSLLNARNNLGATDVALVIPIYQADFNSSDIYAGGDTPTDESLISAINYAHSLGLKVVLKPHLGTQNGGWRAHINASDRDAWFSNYGSMLNRYGDIGQQTGVAGMTIATELISMAAETSNFDNTQRWNAMIQELRQHFKGFLTYSANWGGDFFTEEVAHIGFWPALDFIGISAYYPLSEGQNNPSLDSLRGSWNYWNDAKIRTLHEQYNKPIIFAEIGYRSADRAHDRPFDHAMGGYNPTEQSNDYEALFSYWNDYSYIKGIYIWNWLSNPNSGGEGDTDYTPQNKPAQSVIASWFTDSGTGNDGGNDGGAGGGDNGGNDGGAGSGDNDGNNSGTPSQVAGDWNLSGQAGAISAGQSSDVQISVNNAGQATNVIIDVEIYDQNSGSRVQQNFYEGQNISASASGQYNINFIPTNNGPYVVKIGIFNSDWSNLYLWNDSLLVLSTSGSGPGNDENGSGDGDGSGGNDNGGAVPPTEEPGPVTLDIWWPSDGSLVSGVQPFKAMVTNRSVSEYSMYWQVDGDALNEMYNSDVDYPHKEALVDVGSWNWRDNGPYHVSFIAKDSSGNVIAEKSVDIRH